jgi:hypothetical protein
MSLRFAYNTNGAANHRLDDAIHLGFHFGGRDEVPQLLSLSGAEAFSVAQAHLPTAPPDRNRA